MYAIFLWFYRIPVVRCKRDVAPNLDYSSLSANSDILVAHGNITLILHRLYSLAWVIYWLIDWIHTLHRTPMTTHANPARGQKRSREIGNNDQYYGATHSTHRQRNTAIRIDFPLLRQATQSTRPGFDSHIPSLHHTSRPMTDVRSENTRV